MFIVVRSYWLIWRRCCCGTPTRTKYIKQKDEEAPDMDNRKSM
jgi:hypothetical protein